MHVLNLQQLERQQKRIIEVIKVYSSDDSNFSEISAVKNVRLSEPKKNSSWKTSGSNNQNFSGNIYLTGVNNIFLKKKIGKNKFFLSKVMTSPIIYDGIIFFSDDTGTIYSIDKKGKLKWKKNIYRKVYKKIYKNLSLAIYENKIYAADNIGYIYALDIGTGKLNWIKNHAVPFKSKIKLFDNKIFLINQDNRLICLDAEKGSKIWDIRTISSFIKSQNFLSLAISKEGDVIALNSTGELIKASSINGNVAWALNVTGTMSANETDFFRSSEIVISNQDIIFSTISTVYSFNLSSGYLNWKKDIGTTNTPIIVNNNIFLISDNGYFINLEKDSGNIIWSTNILKILKKKKRTTQIVGFIMGSGKIYATTSNGYLIICSGTSGKIESFKKIGGPISSAPIINDGSLYILTEKPMILGFN